MDAKKSRGRQSAYCVLPESALEQAGAVPAWVARPPGVRERVHLRRPADLPGVELWSVTASTRLWTIYHHTFAFCSGETWQGRQSWLYRRQVRHMRPARSTMLLQPGEVHVTTELPISDFRVVIVDPKVIVREFAGERREPGSNIAVSQLEHPGLVTTFRELCRSIELAGADAFERRALLRRYLWQAFELAGETPPEVSGAICSRAVKRAREMLRERYLELPSLDEIAREAACSKYHLERMFRDRIGVPMHRYVRLVRVSEARRLLTRGMRPGAVARAVGFTDVSHLIRTFRAELGMTPGSYRAG
jgi:AraC-like DNA-binding protein